MFKGKLKHELYDMAKARGYKLTGKYAKKKSADFRTYIKGH